MSSDETNIPPVLPSDSSPQWEAQRWVQAARGLMVEEFRQAVSETNSDQMPTKLRRDNVIEPILGLPPIRTMPKQTFSERMEYHTAKIKSGGNTELEIVSPTVLRIPVAGREALAAIQPTEQVVTLSPRSNKMHTERIPALHAKLKRIRDEAAGRNGERARAAVSLAAVNR